MSFGGFYSSASSCKVVKRVGGEEETPWKAIAKSGAWVINNYTEEGQSR